MECREGYVIVNVDRNLSEIEKRFIVAVTKYINNLVTNKIESENPILIDWLKCIEEIL